MVGRRAVLVGDGLRTRSITGDDRHQAGCLAGVSEGGKHGSGDVSQTDDRISDLLRHALPVLSELTRMGVKPTKCKGEATEFRYVPPERGGTEERCPSQDLGPA